ncbi:MAG: hypothetical protein A2Y66_02800 [Nitrospirae bacterium RBG_13_41_22]|nr:MAG: hypothetical protein A2Y66_02800 [Nitrospirae bacterium RBG_13_41_22]
MIKIPFALLADYSNVSKEGKLNILGIFTHLYALKEPITHPQMQLVFTLEADRVETGRKHHLDIELIDGDGKKVFTFGADFEFSEPAAGETRVSANQNLVINNMQFPHFGKYDFKILVNDEVRGEAELNILPIPSQTAPAQGPVE